jgi:hypothetical protein
MTSVTRFLRQLPTGMQYSSVPAALLTGTGVYEFVPSVGNYVGNYTPGHMQVASAALIAALGTAGTTSDLVLRDMGKTIKAPVGSTTSPTGFGFFRQVQLLKPVDGLVAPSTFGVLGAPGTPDAYTNYLTFYIAVPLDGVLGGTLSGVTPIVGGQM